MKLMYSCKEATQLMSEGLDHSLSVPQWLLLKMHVALCQACQYYARQIKALEDLLEKASPFKEEQPPPSGPSQYEESRRRMKAMLQKKE